MAIEVVREYLRQWNVENRIVEFPVSSATVELAARAVGCEPARIAKTLSFFIPERTADAGQAAGDTGRGEHGNENGNGNGNKNVIPAHAVLIVAAGDAKVDNSKYKHFFHTKATMLHGEQVTELIGHAIGGVCPFGVKEGTEIYLDISLKRFETVFPAAGSSNSAIEVTMEELERFSGSHAWVDLCKGWQDTSDVQG
ncbi:MAG: YbaK/EbsC family protein [Lachnospiraceae bacterium]|nr:YbaK/EbsC family protein [Lachnospiraceae bacterium]